MKSLLTVFILVASGLLENHASAGEVGVIKAVIKA